MSSPKSSPASLNSDDPFGRDNILSFSIPWRNQKVQSHFQTFCHAYLKTHDSHSSQSKNPRPPPAPRPDLSDDPLREVITQFESHQYNEHIDFANIPIPPKRQATCPEFVPLRKSFENAIIYQNKLESQRKELIILSEKLATGEIAADAPCTIQQPDPYEYGYPFASPKQQRILRDAEDEEGFEETLTLAEFVEKATLPKQATDNTWRDLLLCYREFTTREKLLRLFIERYLWAEASAWLEIEYAEEKTNVASPTKRENRITIPLLSHPASRESSTDPCSSPKGSPPPGVALSHPDPPQPLLPLPPPIRPTDEDTSSFGSPDYLSPMSNSLSSFSGVGSEKQPLQGILDINEKSSIIDVAPLTVQPVSLSTFDSSNSLIDSREKSLPEFFPEDRSIRESSGIGWQPLKRESSRNELVPKVESFIPYSLTSAKLIPLSTANNEHYIAKFKKNCTQVLIDAQLIRLSVCQRIQQWLKTYPADFGVGATEMKKLTKIAERAQKQKLLEKERATDPAGTHKHTNSQGPIRKPSSSNPLVHSAQPEIFQSQIQHIKFSLLDVSTKELARQLTLMESELFMNVAGVEFVEMGWLKGKQDDPNHSESIPDIPIADDDSSPEPPPDNDTELASSSNPPLEILPLHQSPLPSPHLRALISHFNLLTNWVATAILLNPLAENRAQVLSYFIDLAEECVILNNFVALMAIDFALSGHSINRLSHTKSLVPKQKLDKYEEMKQLTSITRKSQALRDRMNKTTPPLVPYFGIYLTDLVYVNESKTLTKSGRIHMTKIAVESKVILDIKKTAFKPYSLNPVSEIWAMLQQLRCIDEETLKRRSLELEPPNST
ncbi:putative Ras-specific guanine nucleotide-releasing factor 1 [Blattamonas nauphoetae]|uniref:Ras-specific guanine nucleotide-releasing factor 1 n=1 Tax=Blattamonas nauphoetae TaxID=2049346 RepID=A0ABQ9YGD8_9EUKA|nr:putative Ras-specific guanine nucleotide-releasing factor 1 [Blattamonas nauphoetae]